MQKSSTITVLDMFCGAGGSTTSAVQAGAEVRLAINHWPRAIETPNTNYPNTDHALTDISQADPRRYPSTTVLIASPECTNHSLAKGRKRKSQGQSTFWEAKAPDPAEERSRCTMWDPLRFAEYHNYQLVILENVVDARLWRLWDAWLHAWQVLDYAWEMVYLNSMFVHPTPQSRDRLYFVAWKRGNSKPDLSIRPLAYCVKCGRDVEAIQCWKQPGKRFGKYRQQYVYCCPVCAREVTPYYYPAASAIDWSRPIQRIAERAKPLKPKTMQRIAYGLEKLAGHPFSMPTTRVQDRIRDKVAEPLPTPTATETQALVMSLSHGTPQGYISPCQTHPLFTQTTRDDVALVMPPFIAELHGTSNARSIGEALSTVCTSGSHHGLVIPPFLIDHVAEYRPRALHQPISTIVGGGNHQSLVVPSAWILSYYNNGQLSPVDEATPTVTTLERHALVTATSDKPCVEDCGFRMLEPHEIQAAMAFPKEYIVTGTRREQVKQLGNAVTPPVMQLLMSRCIASLA